MKMIKGSLTKNYEKPIVLEIDLAPQGVLCDSLSGVATGSGSEEADLWGADNN